MKFVHYTHWDQLPESANTLFSYAEKDSVFYSRAWFESLTESGLGADQSVKFVCVEEGEKVMAMLLLMACGGKAWRSLKHGFTPLYSLLLADENQDQVLACLAQGLSRLPIAGLLLEPVARDDSRLNGLQLAMEKSGFDCDFTFRGYNWIHRLQGQTYREYMQARPAHLRNTIARKTRKLEREQGYRIRLFTGDDVLRHMPEYYDIYNASWKQNELENAVFLHTFIERFSKAGWSRLAILYVKEKPVAAQLWFVHLGKASIFRLAYDRAWRHYSPGSLLTSFLMEYVIESDKVSEIDFLTGNDAYKQEWMSERRERYLLGCLRKERLVTESESAVGALKNLVQKLFGKTGAENH